MRTMLSLHLLGPVELRHDGRPLAWPSRKAAAVLLRLALAGPQTRPQLVALLWPDHDEGSGRRNLRRELARLRDAGAGAALRADGDRLALADEVSVDAHAFAALLGRQDGEAALSLWRGAPADGLALAEAPEYMRWLLGERERLQAHWRDALAADAAAHERAGRTAPARAALERLLEADPLQERHHVALMRVLAADGQREAALQRFDHWRRLLADELGLQPMPETEALAHRLRAEPPPAPPPMVRAGWTGELPFVGRQAEVARLQRAFDGGRPIVLAGDAGVGKTRLAQDFAASQGAYALVRCQPGDAELPFAAFARAWRALAGQPPDLGGVAAWVPAELARILPELGPAPPALRNEGERLRFDEACLQAWDAASRDAFDAVVFDDWHLADAASRALLARAAARRRERGAGGAVEILAWRGDADAPGLRDQVQALAAELVVLDRLPAQAVHSLVRQISGATDPARFAARLEAATGGLPFFIVETLRDLAERGLLACDDAGRWHTPFDADTADYRELPLPASVRDAVLARVRRLDSAGARLLEAAALAGEPFAPARLASACALSEGQALLALEQAAQAQLVQARDEGGYGWVHDLARQALDSALTPTRRRLLHHRMALAAEAQGDAAAAARHFEAGGAPSRAVPHRLAAGDAAHALHALAEAAAHWHQGLADAPEPADEAALAARLCLAEWTQGRHDAAQAFHARLQARLAEDHVAPEVRVDLQLRAVDYLSQRGELKDALALLDAMPEPATNVLRLRCWRARVNVLHYLGQVYEGLAVGRKALAVTAPDSRERGELLISLATLAHTGGRMHEAVASADASLTLFERLGDDHGRARSLFYRGIFRIETGAHDAVESDLRASAALAGRHGNVYLQRMVLYNLAASFSNRSRPAEALAVAREAWPTLADAPGEEITLVFRSMFIECHFQRGEWGPMWEHLVPAVEAAAARNQLLTLLSIGNCALEPAAVLGRWDVVEPLLKALDAARALDEVPVAAEIVLGCVYAALVRGDRAAAAAWLARVHPAGEAESPRVRCRAALLRVDFALEGGAGPAALDTLPADDAPGMTPELRLRALLLRWRAGQATRAQVSAALDDPACHAGVALLLARELGGDAYVRQRTRLADGLADWPDLQRSFLATWR